MKATTLDTDIYLLFRNIKNAEYIYEKFEKNLNNIVNINQIVSEINLSYKKAYCNNPSLERLRSKHSNVNRETFNKCRKR